MSPAKTRKGSVRRTLGGFSDSLVYLVFRDPRLLLAVPFVIIQTAAVAVKDVQVVDGHLQKDGW